MRSGNDEELQGETIDTNGIDPRPKVAQRVMHTDARCARQAMSCATDEDAELRY